MLARTWRKGNHSIMLVVLHVGATTMENSMEVLQITKNRTAI